jgi:uncharacterized protein with HEPN domain
MRLPSEVDDDLALLDVMIEALDKVGRYTTGVASDAFMASTLIQDAVALNFLVVGEAAGDLSDTARAMAVDVPWPRMVALRNRIAHGYQFVDRMTIFGLALNDAGLLRKTLHHLRSQLEGRT